MRKTVSEEGSTQGRFLGILAHQIQSPLSTAQALVRTVLRLRQAIPEDEQRDMMEKAVSRVERVQRLAGRYCELEAIRAGAMYRTLGEADLAEAVRGAVKAAGAPSVKTSLPQRPAPVEADPDGLARIVEELLRNAVEHGRPPVRVRLRRVGAARRLSVSDGGGGIPLGVFEDALAGTLRSEAKGLCFGLAIADSLARAYGGGLRARGATVTLELSATESRSAKTPE